MKKEFIKELEKIAKKDKKIFFLTGDLGFNAFEDIRDSLGPRFINAGVAEQNMISVSAGLASTGLKPWVYSISTFLTLKTVEQVRNDICHLDLPVKLVGFGGGYGYGIMGESHHLLEDIAIYSSFPNMKIYVPAFLEDIPVIVNIIHKNNSPSYLRLNLAPRYPGKISKYTSNRQILKGNKLTIVVLGPLIHNVLEAIKINGDNKVADVFCVTELPMNLSSKIINSIEKTKRLIIIEEHVGNGGLGEKIFSALGRRSSGHKSYLHLFAKGYVSGKYGSHAFHQEENQLDAKSIAENIIQILKND